MKSIWETAAQRELSDRLLTLSADRRPLWGKMSAQQMVCHLTESLKMALGELPVTPKNLPLRYPPLKQLVIYLAPFPKGAPTAPELVITATPNEWAGDVRTLTTLMDRFAARGPAGPPAPAGNGGPARGPSGGADRPATRRSRHAGHR